MRVCQQLDGMPSFMGAIHIRNLRSSQLGLVRSITAPLLKSRASIPSRTPVPWFPGTLFFRPCDLGGSKSGATVASKAVKTRGQPRSRSARSAIASRPIGCCRLDGMSPPGPNGSTVRNLMAFISSNACKLMAIKAITSRPRHP